MIAIRLSETVVAATALFALALAGGCGARERAGGDGGGGAAAVSASPTDATIETATAVASPIDSYDVKRDCPASSGRTYEVGPGKKLSSVGDVPWEKLGKGDRVLIHARPQPYREHIVLSAIGTADAPVRVCGVPDASGKLPVLSGNGGTTRSRIGLRYPAVLERGLVVFALQEGQRWGQKPSHIQLSGLEIRDAHPTSAAFTDHKGEKRRFRDNASAVFIERGAHISVTHCVLTNSGNGFFTASGDSEEMVSRDIALLASHVYGNGVEGSYRMHNAYTEAIGMLYEGNRFGPLRSGATGNAIKDRSAFTTVRYNWIEGGAHLLDLVDAEDSYQLTSGDPRYHQVFVYGNVMMNGPKDGSSLIHFGGDTGIERIYRKGPLFFVHNTVIIRGSESQRYFTSLLRLETNAQRAIAVNNVIYVDGSTRPTWLKYAGQLSLGRNWVNRKVADFKRGEDGAAVAGQGKLISGDGRPFAGAELKPSAALAKHSAAPLPNELPKEHRPDRQYRPHLQTVPRTSVKRLGAIE